MHADVYMHTGGVFANRVLMYVRKHEPCFDIDLGVLSPGYRAVPEPSFWLVKEDWLFHVCRTLIVQRGEERFVSCLYY